MGATKNYLYTEEQIELANLFKALAHPARIAIIENLLEHDDLNCNDLRSFIQLAQSTISAHIKQLHGVGVLAVKVVKSGAYYKPVLFALEQMAGYLQYVFPKAKKVNLSDPTLYCKPLRYISPHYFKFQT